MKTKRKLLLGMTTLAAIFLLGNQVNAVEIQSRVLNQNELSLKASGTLITGANKEVSRVTLDGEEASMWNTLKNGGTVSLNREDVQSFQNILCINSHATMPYVQARYHKVGEETNSNDAIAYILSEPRRGETGELYLQTIQGALWRTGINLGFGTITLEDGSPTQGQELYAEAMAFENYRKNYIAPSAAETKEKTTNEEGNKFVGPLKITYKTGYCNSARFGEIIGATLKDERGNTIDKSLWGFRIKESDGTWKNLSNTLGGAEYAYPTSDQEFYIYIDKSVIATKANLSFAFNNLSAESEYLSLEGTYHKEAGKGVSLCPECRKKLEKCGDKYDGIVREGYKVESKSIYAECNEWYDRVIGGGIDTQRRAKASKTIYTKRYFDKDGNLIKKEEPKTVRCGGSVEIYECWEDNDYKPEKAGGEDFWCGDGECAGAPVWVTQYELTPCTVDNPCSNCEEAYEGCGATIHGSYVDKEGEVHESGSICGHKWDNPEEDRAAQPLIIAQGNRSTTETTLQVEFNVASVDIALRKFITAVNDQAITDRVPSVDTTPLKNGETTANYNHTKEAVGVKIGDLVTYTIRVYNEGTADGYAKEITDYLPDNLEFASGTVDGVNYNWQVSGNVIKTSYLAGQKLEKYSDGVTYRGEPDYADVKVICKVKYTAKLHEKLVNIAEVSKYAYHDASTGQAIDISSDIDSNENNIQLPSKSDWPNYAGNGSNGNYVKGQEDDDDFERVDVVYIVDLALRKFITNVSGVAVTNRVPSVDTTPLKNGETTANYNHTKEVVGVKIGDLVTYTIRVYNEGTADGYAKEITDYLPDNLEFVSGTVEGTNYNWQVNGNVIKTSYLAGRKLEKFSDGKNYRSEIDYADVKVICRVKDTVVPNEKLVNLAEVSKYGQHDSSTGGVIDISSDIDSNENNIQLPSKSDWPNYAGNGSNGNYVKGQEDDDDFERLAVLYTDMGGTVWLDGVEGKQEERDGILTGKDQRMEGIIVRLYRESQPNTVIAETKTDKNGNYTFTKARINGVEQNIPVNESYIVRFEYGGQQYNPVAVTRLNSGNYTKENSAGEETEADRSALNAKFYEIVRGTAKYSSGETSVGLSYTRDEAKHTSTIIRNQAFYNESKIQANTVSFSGTEKYVKYINLGLIERAQINLGLLTDVHDVKLTINGQEATYDNYNEKGKEKDESTDDNLKIKVKYIDWVYNQAIYRSDYNYRISDYNQEGTTVRPNASNELQAYVTYKIKVKNYSSQAGSVSELTTYYEPEYNVVDAWYEKGNSKGSVKWVAGRETNGYKTIKTNSIKDVKLGANEELYVYVTFQVAKTKDEKRELILEEEKYIISEITGYTSEKGLIDTNSEPGNIDTSNWETYKTTYEDDTDRAPGLKLQVVDTSRSMTGFVWEDIATETGPYEVKIGDGIKNGKELNKDGITVQLIELVKIDGETYEYIWQEEQTGYDKVSYMDRNGKLHEGKNSKIVEVGTGEYKFTDYVPGIYIVRFKYGDTENSIAVNGQDYKSTTYTGYGDNTSSAKDNKDRRYEVMDYSKEQTNAKGEILAATNKENPLHKELLANTWMYADTVEKMTIGIKDETPGHKVNFGLVKRPISKLVAIKEVAGIKISNKGITYVDTANGINTGLKQIGGSYSIELDDELINGAQLEVTFNVRVKNEGEKDTLYNYFEGESKYGSDQDKPIKSGANLVYDYPEKLGYDEDENINQNWTNQGVETTILKQEVQEAIKKGAVVIKATGGNIYEKLAPGESTDNITITQSKIMAAGGDDDLSYSNKVEIVSRTNEVGRRDEESIPGNYVPKSKVGEPDTDESEVTITDPMGQTRIYYALGISMGILFIAGVVLIQKKVLGKRK